MKQAPYRLRKLREEVNAPIPDRGFQLVDFHIKLNLKSSI